jgi:hypothetical protein
MEARRLNLSRLRQAQTIGEQQIRENELGLNAAALQNQELQEKLARARRVREILATAPDEATALAEVGKVDPDAQAILEQRFNQRRTEQRRQYEFTERLRGDLGRSLYAVLGEKDPAKRIAVYRVQRARLAAQPEYKDLIQHIPEEMPEEGELTSLAVGMLPPEDQQKLRQSEDLLLTLPDYLAKRFNQPPGTKVSAANLANIVRAAGYAEDMEERAEARNHPKPVATHFFQDDAGNVSAVVVKADGTIQATPVKGARGRASRGPAGGQLSAAQRQQRFEEIEREEYGYGGRPGVHQVLQSLGNVLKTGKELDAKGNATELTPERRQQIEDRIELLTKHRDSLMKEKLALGKTTESDIAPKAGGSQPPAEVLAKVPEGKTFTGPDGRRWRKVNGKAVPIS